jgi:hypothetical protein
METETMTADQMLQMARDILATTEKLIMLIDEYEQYCPDRFSHRPSLDPVLLNQAVEEVGANYAIREVDAGEREAWERGCAAYKSGAPKRAVPAEYREPSRSHEALAWMRGWETEAERRQP